MKDLNRHSFNVGRLSVLIGIELELYPEKLRILSMSGFYHDIGKNKIDESVLNKKEKLSLVEKEIIKGHSRYSADILSGLGLNFEVIQAVMYHHERWDGKGYPRGLEGENIPLYSRIIAVADSYDAMTHDRPYSMAMKHEEAIRELINGSGTQFDARIVNAFLKLSKTEYEDSCINYA